MKPVPSLLVRRTVLVILLALAVFGFFRLKLDVEVLNLLPSNPISRGLLLYQQRFLNSGELIITLQSTNADLAAKGVKEVVSALRPATNLVANLFWQPPWNDSIEASAEFLSYLWLNGPPSRIQQLEQSLRAENIPALLSDTKERMTTSLNPADLMLLPRDPYGFSAIASMDSQTFQTPERFFGSADGTFRMIYAYSAAPLDNYAQCHEWLQKVRPLMKASLEKAGLASQVKVQLTGRPVFVDEIASGMKSDMSTNAPGTLLMIGLLFWLVHREVRALLLLLAMLLLVMVWAALTGAALLGQLNVISIGFASILLGLAEDFAIVLHQEAKLHPHLAIGEVRRLAGPGIFWSAITTASAFALLNLSSLPGLRQLGTLVAIGILLGAWVMSYGFLPLLYRFRSARKPSTPIRESQHSFEIDRTAPRTIARAMTLLVLIGAAAWLLHRAPVLNPSPDVLRPRQSEASRALALVQENLGVELEPYWLIVHGRTAGEVRETMLRLEPVLRENVSRGTISSYNLPLEIWSNPVSQQENLPVLRKIGLEKSMLVSAAVKQGFRSDAMGLTSTVLSNWVSIPTNPAVQWPRGRIADWLLPRFASVGPTNVMALGLVYPTASFDAQEVLPKELSSEVLLSGWRLLGKSVFSEVKREIPVISLSVFAIVLVALYLTFRSWRDVLLSFEVLALSGLLLLATMSLLGWEWNLINLTSVPLLLGMGIDYSIHIQLTMRRLKNNATAVFQNVGRALLLAGSTSIIGFALLGTSSNLGMASLGRVCALGLTITLLVSVFLLPYWGATGRAGRGRN